MTQANVELLAALEMAGVPKREARAAAAAAAPAAALADLPTRAGLKAALADLKADLMRQHYGGLAVVLAAIGALGLFG